MNRFLCTVLGALTFFTVSFGLEYGRQLFQMVSSGYERYEVVQADAKIVQAVSGPDFWTHYIELAFVVLVICSLAFLVVGAVLSRWLEPKNVKYVVVAGALAAVIPIIFMHTEFFAYGCILPESSLHPLPGYSLLEAVSGVVALAIQQASDKLGGRST